jgi:hypothetical protein
LITAFFVGDAELRFVKSDPIETRRQHVLLLVAGVLTLALLRSVLGGVVVFASLLFGLGGLTLMVYRSFAGHATPATA